MQFYILPGIGIEALRNCGALGVAGDIKCCGMDTVRGAFSRFGNVPCAANGPTGAYGVEWRSLKISIIRSLGCLCALTASTRVSAMELPVPTSVNCKVVEVSVA